jgi:tyrosyl-tRNA synthetase
MLIEDEEFFKNSAKINRLYAENKKGCCKFVKIDTDYPKIIDVLVEVGIVESKNQCRRLIEQNGITIDESWECEQKPTDINCIVDLSIDDFFDVRIGKKKHFRIFCLTPKEFLKN